MLHSERIRIIVDEMLAGKSKHAIVLEYADKWNTKPKTIKNMINEAIVYLHQVHTGNSVEEMRSEQVAKLEELYSTATTSEKLKIIDLVSSTLGLYDNKLTVKQEDEIKINLGV
jgi:myo-inositol catabolism protein IolC